MDEQMKKAWGRALLTPLGPHQIDKHLPVILAFPVICWLGDGEEVLAPGGDLIEGISG